MKLFRYLTVAGIGILAACQPQENKTTESKVASATKQTCYTYTKDRDTATLMLITSGRVVTGELIYKLFEKDSNHGTIKGEMRGDTLVADYIFNSEGKQSTRQVAFLKKDGKLAEGYGDILEKDGKMIFNNVATLKFGDAIEFTEVNCK
jgi:hypothetical protein